MPALAGPANNFIEEEIDLQRLLITNWPATFLVRVAGDSMVGARLFDGDLAVVDRSLHGSFSRADTAILGGAIGPDFKTGFVDPAPTSNADVGKTMARILGLEIKDVGKLVGRPLTEAMPGGVVPEWSTGSEASEPDGAGRRTVVLTQAVGGTRYFDAAGYPGRTLGLPAEGPATGR